MTSLTAHGEPPRYFTFPALAAAGLPHASTTRHCPGVTSPSQPTSPFTSDAHETLAAAGLDLARVAYARQVHGADVAHGLTRGGVAGAVDVLSTAERGMPLAVFTADCLAITLWDAESAALALAHVGWRGTVKRAQQSAVAAATALGASPRQVMRMIIGQGLKLATFGIGVGAVCALGAARSMSSLLYQVNLLYQVSPTDPLTFVGVPLVFGVVTAAACWIPARRAMRVDPLVALRHE